MTLRGLLVSTALRASTNDYSTRKTSTILMVFCGDYTMWDGIAGRKMLRGGCARSKSSRVRSLFITYIRGRSYFDSTKELLLFTHGATIINSVSSSAELRNMISQQCEQCNEVWELRSERSSRLLSRSHSASLRCSSH